jgi:lysine 2,3-aminomutase
MPAIECAKRLGCYVITVDNVPRNPGHRCGDLSENVSTTDLDGVLELAKKHKVDGVMTYGSDVSAPAVAYVSEKLNLSGNPFNSALKLQRKDLFRSFLRDKGLPHPEFFTASTVEEALEKCSSEEFALVVKPSDSSGSKGQNVVRKRGEIEDAFNQALTFSRCGIVVFEKFLNNDMLELDGDILIQDGKLAFRHYGHNYFAKDAEKSVPVGEIMPGFFSEEICLELDRQFGEIINGFNLKTGCMNFDGIVSNGVVYIVDIGLRNGGNYVPDLIYHSTGVNLTEAAVYSAFGVEYPADKLVPKEIRPVFSYILNAKEEGYFGGFNISQELLDKMVFSQPFAEFGKEVSKFTRGDNALGIAFFRFDDMESMKKAVETVEDNIVTKVFPFEREHAENKDGILYGYKRYSELISPFLAGKINELERNNRIKDAECLKRQFVQDMNELNIENEAVQKHYEAHAGFEFEEKALNGIERLYKRLLIIEPLLQCAAHCRHCLRRNYESHQMSEDDISRITRFVGQSPAMADVREILVTGGDPFLIPEKLSFLLRNLAENAGERLEVVRVASRLPVHQPGWIGEKLLSVLRQKYPFRVEMATQINSAIELFPEVADAYKKIRENVSAIYNQTVLLANVNDTFDDLVSLFDRMRSIGIENHYIFHCVPIGGLRSLRTPLDESLKLIRKINTSGHISGRIKPHFALMTDVGKVTLYEDTIIEKKDNKYLLQTHYSYEERKTWNPYWELPKNAEVDENGELRVWYIDA